MYLLNRHAVQPGEYQDNIQVHVNTQKEVQELRLTDTQCACGQSLPCSNRQSCRPIWLSCSRSSKVSKCGREGNQICALAFSHHTVSSIKVSFGHSSLSCDIMFLLGQLHFDI
jgi:hypothetical protein